MKALLNSCIFVAGTLLSQAALAQAGGVTSTLLANRVETVDGKQVLTPAEKGKPGDVLEYSGIYRNGGKNAVDKLVATIPVPTGTAYVGGSAVPARAQASTDGAAFAPTPLMRPVRQADGSTRQEPVPLADYRYLRWDLGTLAAGTETVVKLRVQIDPTPPAARAATAKP